jgi:hypothetical protein
VSGWSSWAIAVAIHAALVVGASLVRSERPLSTDVSIGDEGGFTISFAPPAAWLEIPREPDTFSYPRMMSEELPEMPWAGTDDDWGEQRAAFTVSCYEDERGRWHCKVSPSSGAARPGVDAIRGRAQDLIPNCLRKNFRSRLE